MERVSGLLSWTLSRVLWLSGFSEQGAARQPRIMEEKALEVYVNKQINDKERVAAAMENPNLREIVEQCVLEPD
ncbi:hypothetical protein NN561_016478 [Cricetulus griseus]